MRTAPSRRLSGRGSVAGWLVVAALAGAVGGCTRLRQVAGEARDAAGAPVPGPRANVAAPDARVDRPSTDAGDAAPEGSPVTEADPPSDGAVDAPADAAGASEGDARADGADAKFDASPADAAPDASPDTSPEPPRSCQEVAAEMIEVHAAHAACTVDDDCALPLLKLYGYSPRLGCSSCCSVVLSDQDGRDPLVDLAQEWISAGCESMGCNDGDMGLPACVSGLCQLVD